MPPHPASRTSPWRRIVRLGRWPLSRFLPLTVVAALLAAAPARAQTRALDLEPLRYAREIVDTIMPPAKRTEMAMTMARALADQMRVAVMAQLDDQGLRQIVEAHLSKSIENAAPLYERHMPLVAEAMMRAYVREFSLAELQQIRAFAASPAGAHYFSRSTALISDPDVAVANSALMAAAQRTAQTENAALRETVRNYMAKHPDVARKVTQQQERRTPAQ